MKSIVGLSPLLDRESEVPIYKQLYQYIRRQIESGRLKENDRLPPIRQLSAHLLIGKNTVETAYQQLLAEGYVQSKPRSGLLVLPVPVRPMAGREEAAGIPLRSGEIAEGGAEASSTAIVDFQYGDIALERFPLAAWKRCLTEALTGDRR